MNTRRRYQSSRFGFGSRTSSSVGLLSSTILPSSYRNREPSDQKLVNPSVANDVSIHKTSAIHSWTARQKNYQNKHFMSTSGTHCQEGEKYNPRGDIPAPGEKDSLKDIISETTEVSSPEIHPDKSTVDVNPLTVMEIKSAAQWKAVSGRVIWNLEKTVQQEKPSKGKRIRGRQRVPAPAKPRDRTRYVTTEY